MEQSYIFISLILIADTTIKHSHLTLYRSKKCIAAQKFVIHRQNATAQLSLFHEYVFKLWK